MRETESKPGWRGLYERFTLWTGTKLIGLLVGAMVVILALLGYLTIRLHRQHLESSALVSAERISDVIRRNTTFI